MQPASDRPTALRESWRRPDLAGPRGRWQRRWRRWAIAAVAGVLVGTLAYLLFSPFWHPTTRLLEFSGGAYDAFQIPPLEFAAEDAAAIRAPLTRAFPIPGQTPLVQTHVLRSPDDVARLVAALDALPADSSDVVLIYLAAHGVARDGQAYLLCQSFTPSAAEQGSYPLAKLLRQLQLSPAGLKLLLLDHGRVDFDPRLGMIVNEFPRLLRDDVAALRDAQGRPESSVWVLAAHSPLEQSHVDYGRRQSVFGGAVGRALSGQADANGDQFLTLEELARYVRRETFWNVMDATNRRAEQTPELLGPTGSAAPADLKLLSVPRQSLNVSLQLADRATVTPEAVDGAKTVGDATTPTKDGAADKKSDGAAQPTADGVSAPASDPADPQADAASPAAQASSGPEKSKGPAPDAPLEFPAREAPLSQMIDYAWRQTASWEAVGPVEDSPIDNAPGWWRVWKERLLARERVDRFGGADKAALAIALRQDLATLFAPDLAAPRPLPELAARRLAHARATTGAIAKNLPSVTILERSTRHGGTGPPEAIHELLVDLDRLLSEDEPKPFREWLEKKPWPKEAGGFVELRMVRDWSERPTIDWPRLRLAWQTCRVGERVASDPVVARDWARLRLLTADSWQRAGQRQLGSQIGRNWSGRADASLREALRQYQSLAADLATWRDCETLRTRGLPRASDHARWRHLAAGDPALGTKFDDLLQFLDTLAELSRELESAQPVLARLVDLRDRITALDLRLQAPFQEPRIDTWLSETARPAERTARIEALLQSTLITPTVRSILSAAAAQPSPVDPDASAGPRSDPDPKILNAASWRRAQDDLVVARKLARLAVLPPEDDAGAGDRLERAWTQAFDEQGGLRRDDASRSPGPSEFWKAYRDYGSALRAFYEGLPQRLTDSLRKRENLTDPALRPHHLQAVRALQRAECLLDARDVQRLGESSPAQALRRAAWYDVLRLQQDRCLAALDDAPSGDGESWLDAAKRFGNAASAVPLQPELPAVPERIVGWEGPTSIALTGEPKRDVTLTLHVRGREPLRAWIVLDYDPELLDVRGPGGTTVYQEDALRESSPPEAQPYPVRPDRWDRPASFNVAPGAPQRLTLTLRRRPAPGNRTLVAVKAVCGDQVVRHELAIQLPSTDTLALVPEGPTESWSPLPDGVALHPLAGHAANYRLQLVNLGLTDRELSVEFLPARNRIPGETPDEFLSLAPADVLQGSNPGPPLMTLGRLRVPADGKPVPLQAPLPKEGAPAGGATGGGGDAPEPASKDGEKGRGIDVRHGLLMVVRDLESGAVIVRRVQFRPQRPRRFLVVEAGYDASLERLTIRVRPRASELVPDKGFRLQASFAEPLPPGTEALLEGLVDAPNYEAQLYASIPAETERLLTVHLAVDDYPRAFTWQVHCGQSRKQIAPTEDSLAIRIRAPAPGTAYLAPAAGVPVEFEVDAPVGAFESPRDVVEIGIDRRRDRELLDDPTVRLFSDRQVDVSLIAWNPAGIVTVLANVHDFRLTVPATGLRNLRADLLGQARIGSRTGWSEPVGVLFDAAPPEIQHVELQPGRTVAQMSELQVLVTATDDQQSGVGKVELALDVENRGEFGAAPPVAAAPAGSGRWLAKLPVETPNAGPTRLLVRATDKVGNVGEYTKVPVEVITPMEAAERVKSTTNRVSGVVLFSKQAVSAAKVELRDEKNKVVAAETTDAQGRFVFPKVPQGKYKLWARGISRNRSREKELDVVVPPPPAQPVQLEVQLSLPSG